MWRACRYCWSWLTISLFLLLSIFLFDNPVLAWDDITGGDHGGLNWVINIGTSLSGTHTNIGTLTIASGVVVDVRPFDGTDYGKLEIQAQNVDLLGSLNAKGVGYTGNILNIIGGPGGGVGTTNGSGGGGGGAYGGNGATSKTTVLGGSPYGSALNPFDLGSAGGRGESGGFRLGGNGGGAIKIITTNNLNIAGTIKADGNNGATNAGGGSGGSINLTASTFSGSGVISANGGNGITNGGGGSGGRIVLKYSSQNNFSGQITASVGASGTSGEAGTIVILDTGNNDLYIPQNQSWRASSTLDGSVHNYRNITVSPGIIWKLFGFYTPGQNDGVGFIFNTTNFTLGAGSTIFTSGYNGGVGSSATSAGGPGGGNNACDSGGYGSGGAYGGKGGKGSFLGNGVVYGSLSNPVDLGSGGGGGESFGCRLGGNGGGAIVINNSETLNLNGVIYANGDTPPQVKSGGGSGGSINLTTNNLSGNVLLTANGGNSSIAGSGGGSGGRIAVKYAFKDANFILQTSNIGGSGGTGAEPGTTYILDTTNNDLTIDKSQIWDASPQQDGSVFNFRNLTISSGVNWKLKAYKVGGTEGTGFIFNVSNFTLNQGAVIDMAGVGYSGGLIPINGYGPGGGLTTTVGGGYGSGGAYGGAGGSGQYAGGSVYGSPIKPVDIGSGGGGAENVGYRLGGSGGGAIKINATNTLNIGGSIVAVGFSGASRSGGGSGGSIFLIAPEISGSGSLLAGGGPGWDNKAGGGGGRIAVYYSQVNSFIGATDVSPGFLAGAGTYYLSSFPKVPSSLQQYDQNGTDLIANGGNISHENMVIKFLLSAETAMTIVPQVEIRPQGTAFTNTATHTGSQLSYTDTPITAALSINSLTDLQEYHWQARACDTNDICSTWVEYSSDANYDFRILLDFLAPVTNASNLHYDNPRLVSGNWTGQLPKIIWDAAADDPNGSGISAYCLSLVEVGVGLTGPVINPCSDDGVLPGDAPYLVGTTSVDLNSITNLNLVSGKEYFFSIKSVDAVGNIFFGASNGSDYANLLSFKYDGTSPVNVTSISAVSGSYSSLSDIYFTWPTSGQLAAQDVDSGILGYQYSIGNTSNWHGNTTAPTFDFSYLSVNTSQPYFLPASDSTYTGVGANSIYFRTVDKSGNFSPASTYRTALFSFGGDAPSFPNNSSVSVTLLDNVNTSRPANLFDISWPEAEAFQGNSIYKYFYMINTQPPQNYATIKSNSSLYIPTDSTSLSSISLTNIHRGSNTIYVVAVDDNLDAQNALSPNYSPSNSISATFDFNSDLPDPPRNLVVSDSSIKAASLWRASLAWDIPTYAGTGQLSFTIQRSLDGLAWTTVGTSTGLAYLDTVTTSRKYYWRVGSFDNSDDSTINPSYTSGVTLIPRGTYTSPPDLSSQPTLSSITTKKAKISWSTSRTSDSKIALGTESKKYFDEEPSNSTQVTDHVINLTNLTPGTTYYYVAKWTDEDGNTGQSEEKTFTTNAAPTVKDVSISSVGLDAALLKFTSTGASKTKIYYGKSTAFGSVKELSTATEESSYTVQLSELEDGTKYYYKINLTDSEGDEYEGTILSFDTLPRPKISQVAVQQVPKTAQSTLLITWKTNTEISSIITYQPQSQPEQSRDEVDIKLLKGEHKMLLKGLLPDTVYTLIVRGRDLMGNEAVSERITFTTASDTRPPLISDLNIEGSNVPQVTTTGQESTTQLIVSWNTDEPATSQVELGEGSGTSYQQKSQEDSNLTYNHLVIISNLPSSKVYHLRSLSKDKAGNLASSVDTVTITPKATDNALDLVITNLSEAFGFIKNFNQ